MAQINNKFGQKSLTKSEYDDLRQNNENFPYVYNEKFLGMLLKEDDNFTLTTFATAMRVVARLVDYDAGIVKLRLSYFDGRGTVEKDFDSSILTKNGVKELLNSGIRFAEDDALRVVRYLLKSEMCAEVKTSYAKLGWRDLNGAKSFFGYSVMTAGGICSDITYKGNLDLRPTGSLDAWLQMVRKEVLINPATTVVMLLGFTGPLVALLNERIDLGSLMFNLSNKSSKGKTTSAMLAASVFANPALNRGSVISFNSTENALVQFISNCGGHTVVVDEAAMNNTRDFTRIMYSICNGRTKMRLNSDSTQKEVSEFNSVVISTAEYDIVTDDTPTGVKTRVFEIKDTLTDSAENSDNIKKAVRENYAVAGEPFIRHLMKKGDVVFADYEADKQLLCRRCAKINEFTERVFSKLAPILTAARYVNEIFNLGISEEVIMDYLLNLEAKISIDVHPEERLLDIVFQEVTSKECRFKRDISDPPSNCIGVIRKFSLYNEVQILEIVFEQLMYDYNIRDWKTLLKKLKQQGILLTEPDRLYKRVKIAKSLKPQKCYCFKVLLDEGEQNKLPTTPKSIGPSTSSYDDDFELL